MGKHSYSGYDPASRKIFNIFYQSTELFNPPLVLCVNVAHLCGSAHLNLSFMATLTTTANYTATKRDLRIFEKEFLPLIDAVTSFACRLTGDATLADDLVQETYLKAWRFADRYTEDTNAKAWLFRICRNAFINEYRTKRNQPYKVDYEDIVVYHNEDDPVSAHYLDLHEEMGGQLMGDEVTLAINALRPEFRMVVLLDLEDFTYEEIAAIAGIPIGTVRSRLFRARQILQAKLLEYASKQGFRSQDDDDAMPQGRTNDVSKS